MEAGLFLRVTQSAFCVLGYRPLPSVKISKQSLVRKNPDEHSNPLLNLELPYLAPFRPPWLSVRRSQVLVSFAESEIPISIITPKLVYLLLPHHPSKWWWPYSEAYLKGDNNQKSSNPISCLAANSDTLLDPNNPLELAFSLTSLMVYLPS